MSFDLSDSEHTTLEHFQEHGTSAEIRRAQIVLMGAEGADIADIAEAVGLSKSTVRTWLREWDKTRLEIFPDPSERPVEQAAPSGQVFGGEADMLREVRAKPSAAAIEEDSASISLPGIDKPRLALRLDDTVGVQSHDSMAEAGRKALFFHFERMLLNEPGSRHGEDIEAVHDMRVATRRMRSALRLFQPFFKPKAIEPFRRELRRTASTLGYVRDLDVFMEKAQAFEEAHPEHDLAPLYEAWEVRLDDARDALIQYLDGGKFGRFVSDFHAFLVTPGRGARTVGQDGSIAAYQVRHVAPRLIYKHFERVRAYELAMKQPAVATLHALRIDFKRLRYTLEFFEEVLGPEAKDVIKEVKVMQDHLGDLNDAEVAIGVLNDFTAAHEAEFSGIPRFMRPDIGGVYAYLEAKHDEHDRLRTTAPEAFGTFLRPEIRRSLGLAVAAL